MESEITFRTVIEVLGKPKEHVEEALKGYIHKIKTDKNFTLIKEEFAETNQQEEQGLWATFAELEVKTPSVDNLTGFCFDYMPSLLEVISPKEIKFTDANVSQFLNDLQAKLHQIDMIAKQLQVENSFLNKSLGGLLKNYVVVLLSKGDLTSKQLSGLTGINQDKLEDFLDQLIDEQKIDLNDGVYTLKKEVVA
ncbi:MAG TPA: hypothetical protein VJI98_02320 [Candidatus Nanoarchaeia archaeon]|nr:hypothetical protein [Candidatus Nanoarchaeia archaeon]